MKRKDLSYLAEEFENYGDLEVVVASSKKGKKYKIINWYYDEKLNSIVLIKQ